jgi:hypothetical protein
MKNKDILYRGIRNILSSAYLESYQRGLLNNESIKYIVGFCDSNIKTKVKYNKESKRKEFHVIFRREEYIFPYDRFKKAKRQIIDQINKLSTCKEK